MRHRLLGHCAEPAVESPRPDACEESRRGRCRDREGKERRRQDPARARLYRRAGVDVRRLRQGRPPHAHSGLCQGHGTAGAALSQRRRGADPLRARAQHLGVAGRQDLRQPAQGRGHPGADRETPAAASRRGALSDPSLRLSADRRERPRRRAALCQDRARRGPRPAHAVTYLHARRLLEGIDRVQCRSGACREGSQGFPRAAACHGLPGLCLSAARAGREGQGRHRRDDDGHRLHRDVPCRTLCVGRFAGALRGRTRRLEGRGGASGPSQPACLRCRR